MPSSQREAAFYARDRQPLAVTWGLASLETRLFSKRTNQHLTMSAPGEGKPKGQRFETRKCTSILRSLSRLLSLLLGSAAAACARKGDIVLALAGKPIAARRQSV